MKSFQAAEAGRLPGCAALQVDRSRSSDNHGPRAAGYLNPDAVVLHYTGMSDGPSAVDWLCNPASGVSCHYVVHEDGAIQQLVPEERRAWHAGVSHWAGVTDMNSASIGIEVVNGGHDFGLPEFPVDQVDALVALCRDIVGRLNIRPERILAHSDIAPSRKRDPGERFPWARLATSGLGLWAPPFETIEGPVLAPGDFGVYVRLLQEALRDFGFGVIVSGEYDQATEIVVRAFQRHYRPARIDGRADASTVETLRWLAECSAHAKLNRSEQFDPVGGRFPFAPLAERRCPERGG